jgi:hypothetical protein
MFHLSEVEPIEIFEGKFAKNVARLLDEMAFNLEFLEEDD